MTKLSVNLNKFALIRNARGTDFPNVEGMARRTIAAGGHGITVHPRPDERHIKYADVPVLAGVCKEFKSIEYNIEGNPEGDFIDLVLQNRPDQCTLVPDDPNQLTSDHGWDIATHGERLKPLIAKFQDHGIRVSLFMDPEPEQIRRAADTGAQRIELYTEPYADAFGTDSQTEVWEQFALAAECAVQNGLGLNAGHDLNLANLKEFLRIPDILEVSIGHAIVVESFDHGYEETLRRYLELV
ncbi:MAG: pyridoxine 5-phosphate synthase [Parasphingorhabdus sp.]|jgi:pyridoxine 5-phosphate synthase